MFTPKVKAQLFCGIYESAECRFVKEYVSNARYVIELGSSLGVTACHIATVMQEGGRLLCVEANPTLLPVLAKALVPIATRKRLETEVLHAAVVGKHAQQFASLSYGDSSLTSQLCATKGQFAVVEIPAVTLSELVDRSPSERFVLVCDIEGGEAGVIFSDSGALARCRRIVIELHDTTYHGIPVRWMELLRALTNLGFRVVDRRGPVVVLDAL